jgi:hypothetical protein
LDQHSDGPILGHGNLYTNIPNPPNEVWWAESFNPTASGPLDKIVVELARKSIVTQGVFMDLYDQYDNGTGAPSGSPLATAFVPASGVPVEPFSGNATATGPVAFGFLPFAIQMTAGTPLEFVVRTNWFFSGDLQIGIANNSYSGGTTYLNANTNWFSDGAVTHVVFGEYLNDGLPDVPEPGTVALALAGAAALVRRRARR